VLKRLHFFPDRGDALAQPSDLHRQFVQAWNQRDFNTFRALLHPDYAYTDCDGKVTPGPDAGVAAAQALLVAFPDAQTQITSMHTSGDLSLGEFVTKGTQTGVLNGIPASGKSVVVVRCNIIEVKDKLIFREREYMDMLGVLVQIGAVQAPGAAGA
jgi:steroid delta-isomerase-like uncharacterized protein